MIPILFNANENSFTTRGIGALSDALTCVVTEERNGIFEIEMMYPVDGIHFSYIANRKIILAKPNNFADAQPFRIYEISKPIHGIVTVRGQHISYDLSRIPLRPFSASSAADAISKLSSKSAVTNPFTFWTDKDTQATMNVLNPISCRKLLGGVSGSFLDTFGGEWEFDRFTCKLHSTRGKNRGVTIRYGKNLTDVTQEENISACYAGIYPFWTNTDGDYVSLSEEIVYADNADTSLGVQPVDFSSDFDSAPSQSQLRAKAQSYIASNDISTPKVSVSCSFAQLAQTHEFKDLKLMEEVLLCDTVTVYFDRLGISTTAKVIKTVYDVLAERYTSVELGESRNSIASTVNEINEKIEESGRETISALKTAINRATSLISGNAGGYVVLHDSNGDSYPDEILIMNEPNLQTATKVWRWNKQGLGYSGTGYNGDFGLAMTADGEIVADLITTGSLDASIIKTGVLNAGLIKMLDAESGCGLGVGTGSADGETETKGAIVWGGADIPATANNYLISTNAGVRMSSQYTTEADKLHLAKMYVSSGENAPLAQVSTSVDTSNYSRLRCEGNTTTLLGTHGSSVISKRLTQVGLSSGDDTSGMLSYLNFIRNGTTSYEYASSLYSPDGITIATKTGSSNSVNSNMIVQSAGSVLGNTDSALTSVASTGRVDIMAVANRNNNNAVSAVYCNANNKSAPFTQMLATGGAGTSNVTLRPNTVEIYGNEITVGSASDGITINSKGTTIDGKFVQYGSFSVTSSTDEETRVSVMYTSYGCKNFKQDTVPAVVITQGFSSGITIVSDSKWNGFTISVPKTGQVGTRTIGFVAIGQRS